MLRGRPSVIKPPADSGPRPFSSGQTVEVEAGVDLGRVAINVFVRGAQQSEAADYTGNSGGTVYGDFMSFTPGASVRAKLISFDDSQNVPRTWSHLRGG